MRKKTTRTIPSIVGLLILTSLVLGGVYLTQQLKTSPRVAASARPLAVRVANISARSATIYWLTEKPASGSLKINNQVFLDDRDKNSNQPGRYLTHYITIDQLEAEKKYQFTIISEGQNHQEVVFEFTTARSLPAINRNADLAFGLVLNQQGQPLPEALVTLSLAGASNLAGLTDKNGFWSIPLSTAYQKDLSALATYDQNQQIMEILVEPDPNNRATVITNTGNDHPVPPITIGQTYDYSKNPPSPKQYPQDFDWSSPEIKEEINGHFPQEEPAKTETTAQEPEGFLLNITNPQEGETILTTRPEFSGQGPAGQKIKITLESEKKFEQEVAVSSFGSWQWTPPEDLAPGEHTITIEYYDNDGLLQTISRTFVVQAASASPSPTPITPLPTQPPSSKPSPIPTSNPTVIPTISSIIPSSATPTPTKQPSITPTPTPKPTGTEEIVSGNLTPLLILAILGLGLIFWAITTYQKKVL